MTDVAAVSPEVSTTAQAIANGRNWSTSIVGESPDYLKIRDWKLASGSMFTEREVRSAAKVAVIGSKTANELFGPLNPVGQSVRIKNIPFIIIGLLESKGAGMGGQNQDDRIIIPYTTAMKRITGDKYLRSVNVQIASADRMEVAQQQITSLLRQRHRLTAGRDDDFNIFNQKEIADTVNSISRIITLLLGSIAGISLVVGGIGIMNIMLVSVTERTREIGIRIAVGAQPGDIRLQFLIEAITLSLAGRSYRRAVWRWRITTGGSRCEFQSHRFRRLDPPGLRRQLHHRRLLRLLSRPQSRRSRSHRCPALRMKATQSGSRGRLELELCASWVVHFWPRSRWNG